MVDDRDNTSLLLHHLKPSDHTEMQLTMNISNLVHGFHNPKFRRFWITSDHGWILLVKFWFQNILWKFSIVEV